jgi:hypothetical protein
MNTETLDNKIIASLKARGAQTLPELTASIGADGRDVLKRIHVLLGLRQMSSGKAGDKVTYFPVDAAPAASTRVAPPVAAPAAPAAPVAPPPQRSNTSASDRVREVLRQSSVPLAASEVVAKLPDVRRDLIDAILSQRCKAGEFTAVPSASGRGRLYALCSKPVAARVEPIEATAKPATPATAAVAVLLPTVPARRKSTTIIVRPEVKVTRLAVMTLSHGCIIDDGETVEQASVGETCGVFVPTADIPGLIAALQQAMA